MSASKPQSPLDLTGALSVTSLPPTPDFDDAVVDWLPNFAGVSAAGPLRPIPVISPPGGASASPSGAGTMSDQEYIHEIFPEFAGVAQSGNKGATRGTIRQLATANKRARITHASSGVAAPTGLTSAMPATAGEVLPKLDEEDFRILEEAYAPVKSHEIKDLMSRGSYKELVERLNDSSVITDDQLPRYSSALADACIGYMNSLKDDEKIVCVARIGLRAIAIKHQKEKTLSTYDITRHLHLNEIYKIKIGDYGVVKGGDSAVRDHKLVEAEPFSKAIERLKATIGTDPAADVKIAELCLNYADKVFIDSEKDRILMCGIKILFGMQGKLSADGKERLASLRHSLGEVGREKRFADILTLPAGFAARQAYKVTWSDGAIDTVDKSGGGRVYR